MSMDTKQDARVIPSTLVTWCMSHAPWIEAKSYLRPLGRDPSKAIGAEWS